MKVNELKAILNNGGGNYSEGKLINYSTGYMVSIEDVVKINKKVSILNICKIVNHLIKNYQNLGFWVNGGFIYIDNSININSLKKARTIGKLYNQLAIWDCNNNTEIQINKKEK